MATQEAPFDTEKELEKWVKENLHQFVSVSSQLDGFKISTQVGKGGVPDGFCFHYSNKEWCIIECELIKHGVWHHIAEQLIRFVVATKSTDTKRIIRDKLFEHLQDEGQLQSAITELNTTPEGLLQQLELLIEGTEPRFLVFIDESDRDLEVMIAALDARISVFRIKKLLVDGIPHYYSPDQQAPTFEHTPSDVGSVPESDLDIVELLGGGRLYASDGRFRCYQLNGERIINIKRSKLHERQNYFWYGITPSVLDKFEEHSVTHIAFAMADLGVTVVPLYIVREYLKHVKTTNNTDGAIRHYHILISNSETPELFWSADTPRFSVVDYFTLFE